MSRALQGIEWPTRYRPGPGDNQPDRAPSLVEQLVQQFSAAYPDPERRSWIEERVRKWARDQQ